MSYDADLIALIDQRIRAHTRRERAVATVQNRDTTGPGALAVFDGSSVGVPVKVLGNVFCKPGDRVVVDLYGSEWIVTGSFTATTFGEASRLLFGLPFATGSLMSPFYVDLSEFGALTFSKAFDETYIRIGMRASGYVSVAPTRASWAARITQIAGVTPYPATDHTVCILEYNTASVHQGVYSAYRIVGVPAGTYEITMRWRRDSGAGGITSDTNDLMLIEVDEQVRAAVPIL